MTVKIRAKHFKKTYYCSNLGCPLARAAKEIFPNTRPSELVDKLRVKGQVYHHVAYNYHDFLADRYTAERHKYDETVIRTIKLIKSKTNG